MDETIFFGGKSYSGLDFVRINNTKMMLDNFSTEYVKKLCNRQVLNDVAFVMENPVSKLKYNQTKPAVSLYGNTNGKSIPIKVPVGFTEVINTHIDSPMFFLVGNKAYMIDKHIDVHKVISLPGKFDHSLKGVVSKNAKLLYARSYIYNIKSRQLETLTLERYNSPQLFLNDNKVMALFAKKKILFLDLSSKKIISELQPKFIEPNKEYFTPRLKTITGTKNSKELYIMSDKGEVEYWKLKGRKDVLSFEYKGNVDTNDELVSTLLLNPYNEDQLVYSTHKNKINIVDRKTGKSHMTLNADRRMMTKGIDISADQKYLMAYDHHFIYLWNIKNGTLIDVIGSKNSKLYGAIFAKGSPVKIIRISEEMEVWSIKEK